MRAHVRLHTLECIKYIEQKCRLVPLYIRTHTQRSRRPHSDRIHIIQTHAHTYTRTTSKRAHAHPVRRVRILYAQLPVVRIHMHQLTHIYIHAHALVSLHKPPIYTSTHTRVPGRRIARTSACASAHFHTLQLFVVAATATLYNYVSYGDTGIFES